MKNNLNRIRIFLGEGLMIASALCSVFMLQMLSGFSPKSSMSFLLLNVIVLYCLYKLIFLLAGKLIPSLLLTDWLLFLFGATNFYVGQFRGVMILPWDILAIKTAADVIGTYQFFLYPQEILWILVLLVKTVFLTGILKKWKRLLLHRIMPMKRGRFLYSVLSILVCMGLLLGMMRTEKYQSIPDRLYLIERYYKTQGIPVSFFHYCKFLYTPKPEGYSVSDCEQAVSLTTEGGDKAVEPVNVIAIMNESFADFAKIGSIPEIDESLSFTNSLQENTLRGNLYVPVYGGTTVNSEYEFLTGNSTAFMKGCPFSYAVRDDRPSLVRVFEEKGYEVHGMHPANPQNWNRKSVYPFLGMEDFISLDQLEAENPDLINEHTTDAWNYRKVIELYEKKSNEKFFLFNVTMQNHSGYNFDFEAETDAPHVDLSAYETEEGQLSDAENYLSLLRMSDEAFEELIDYFSQVDEPTMICMFGDHQPKLSDDFYTVLNGGTPIDKDDPQDNIRLYTTPFLIWANYDIPEEEMDEISCNYLPGILLDQAFAEVPAYYRFLEELRLQYPVLSANGVYDKDGGFYAVDQVQNEEEILKYRYLEYNNASETSSRILWDIYQ